MAGECMAVSVTAYPYAKMRGTIIIPPGVSNISDYISGHLDDIDFGEPELDFSGSDIEYDVN